MDIHGLCVQTYRHLCVHTCLEKLTNETKRNILKTGISNYSIQNCIFYSFGFDLIAIFIQYPLTTYYKARGNISPGCSSNSEANASELLENPGEMFLWYYMYIYVIRRFKYLLC